MEDGTHICELSGERWTPAELRMLPLERDNWYYSDLNDIPDGMPPQTIGVSSLFGLETCGREPRWLPVRLDLDLDERWEGFSGLDTLTVGQASALLKYVDMGMPGMDRVQDRMADGEHASGWHSVMLEEMVRAETYHWVAEHRDGDVDVYICTDPDGAYYDHRTLLADAEDWDSCINDIELGPGRTVGDVPGLADRVFDALDANWSDIVMHSTSIVDGTVVLEVSNG